MKFSIQIEEKGESSGGGLTLGSLERSKALLLTFEDCVSGRNLDRFLGELERMVLLGAKDARFGSAAANDTWVGVSETQMSEMLKK